MNEYTKLGSVVGLWLGAAFFGAIAWTMTPKPGDPPLHWLFECFRVFCMIAGLAMAIAGILGAVDWFRFMNAERVEQLKRARVADARDLAYAYKGLATSTIEIIESRSHAEIIAIPGIPEPVHYLQCVHQKVPMDFVVAFIDASQKTAPYLFPERDARDLHDEDGDTWRNAVALATALTNQMINMGLAEKAAGPYSAVLTVELREAARAVDVTLGEG